MLSIFSHMKPVCDATSGPGLPVLFNTTTLRPGDTSAIVLLKRVATTRRVLQNVEYQNNVFTLSCVLLSKRHCL